MFSSPEIQGGRFSIFFLLLLRLSISPALRSGIQGGNTVDGSFFIALSILLLSFSGIQGEIFSDLPSFIFLLTISLIWLFGIHGGSSSDVLFFLPVSNFFPSFVGIHGGKFPETFSFAFLLLISLAFSIELLFIVSLLCCPGIQGGISLFDLFHVDFCDDFSCITGSSLLVFSLDTPSFFWFKIHGGKFSCIPLFLLMTSSACFSGSDVVFRSFELLLSNFGVAFSSLPGIHGGIYETSFFDCSLVKEWISGLILSWLASGLNFSVISFADFTLLSSSFSSIIAPGTQGGRLFTVLMSLLSLVLFSILNILSFEVAGLRNGLDSFLLVESSLALLFGNWFSVCFFTSNDLSCWCKTSWCDLLCFASSFLRTFGIFWIASE